MVGITQGFCAARHSRAASGRECAGLRQEISRASWRDPGAVLLGDPTALRDPRLLASDRSRWRRATVVRPTRSAGGVELGALAFRRNPEVPLADEAPVRSNPVTLTEAARRGILRVTSERELPSRTHRDPALRRGARGDGVRDGGRIREMMRRSGTACSTSGPSAMAKSFASPHMPTRPGRSKPPGCRSS
jgi:hypothetical protein